MEEKNKKMLQFTALFLLIGVLLINCVSAQEVVNYNYYYKFDGIQLTQLKYEPYPVGPGEYFEVWFKASLGDTNYARFELIEEFPFSLDSNEEAVRVYEDAENREVVMRYKVRVDKDAVKGTNELKLKYTSNKYSDLSVIKHFDISVDQVQTSFDAVIQEATSSEVSIAIANTGKYTANSVVVRIPEQEGFKVTGANEQMVGNLGAGNSSVVSFSLAPLMQEDSQKKSLKFDVHYTDTIGERRIVNMVASKEYKIFEDSKTSFDAVVQEATSSEVSIAIANTGKYTANSVVVRIPEQEGFKVTGTDGQMVGNLDAGDYTIVSFSLITLVQGDSQKKSLKFDVHYTDTIGERRVVNMETPLKISSGGSDIPGSKKGMKEETSGINWAFWMILGIIIIGCFVVYKKYPKQTKKSYNKLKQKIKGLFNKNKSKDSSKVIPDWMKNAKDKEKKK